ncbi:MAG: carboxypeptidase M32, partial [Candidatus Omnitrophica bacterium]|nr:carboxypeptidase M32 [Candidatus Omnitrophota bacterium]
MEKFKNKLILKILEKFQAIAALESLAALADWDLNTYMPVKAAEDRGFILGKVNILMKNLILDKDFKNLIEKCQLEDLNEYEKAVVRILTREINIIEKLPDDFIENWNKTTNQAQVVWREAKKNNDFKKFQPYLQKIIDLVKKKSELLSYQDHPYDALVDLFEEGWTTADFNVFFNLIKEPLRNLLAKIQSAPNYQGKHPLEDEIYDKEKMKELNFYVLSLLK